MRPVAAELAAVAPCAAADSPAEAEVFDESIRESSDDERDDGYKPRVNIGGRPKGTTDIAKVARKNAKVDASNWVVRQYHKVQMAAKEKGTKVKNGVRVELVKEAIEKFSIKGDFDVSRQVISARIKSTNLEVFHPGTVAPLLVVETCLVAFIHTSWCVNAPLTLDDCKDTMNDLIKETRFELVMKKFKKQRGIYQIDKDVPLCGEVWWAGFRRRNPEVDAKVGKKYGRNRDEHCNDSSFNKMYHQVEDAFVESGNSEKLDEPVLMDEHGNEVQEEKLAFGRPVTLRHTRPSNIFCMDETGSNTHGKDDARV